MEDSTAGIALYDLTTNNYLANVNRGDSLTITGELADYNGLLRGICYRISNDTLIK